MDNVTGAAGRGALQFDPADPTTILDALQIAFSGQLQESLLASLEQSRRLTERARLLAELPQQLAARRLERPVEVSTAALRACLQSGGDLDRLFAADGPNLGDKLESAERLYRQLQSCGIDIDAPLRYPVLKQSGTPPNEKAELLWLSSAEREALDRYPGSPGPVEGSVLKTDGSGEQAVSWLCLDAWANRKTGNAALDECGAAADAKLGPAVQELENAGRQIEMALLSLFLFLQQMEGQGRSADRERYQANQRRIEDLQREIQDRRRQERDIEARQDERRNGMAAPEKGAAQQRKGDWNA